MRQILQDMRRGETTICEAPAPVVSRGSVLIHTSVSLIAGTERMLVGFGKASLLDKALQQPERVKMVLAKVRTDGLLSTVDAVQLETGPTIATGLLQRGRGRTSRFERTGVSGG